MVRRFYDTTAPTKEGIGQTKEGLLWDDKIVSNLHEQTSDRGTRNQLCRPVWCAAFDAAAACWV